eukprot:TRINITY_DN92408_c0_g1_i1.p1 TRINITY_DN92408_c0_g1~~TRINITY_DN92408_c0_g1_i1.p1  ORF type:complete len:169 (+),score=27.43 TRINITY_DN92408_c0_g1_i1:41-508(+)
MITPLGLLLVSAVVACELQDADSNNGDDWALPEERCSPALQASFLQTEHFVQEVFVEATPRKTTSSHPGSHIAASWVNLLRALLPGKLRSFSETRIPPEPLDTYDYRIDASILGIGFLAIVILFVWLAQSPGESQAKPQPDLSSTLASWLAPGPG